MARVRFVVLLGEQGAPKGTGSRACSCHLGPPLLQLCGVSRACSHDLSILRLRSQVAGLTTQARLILSCKARKLQAAHGCSTGAPGRSPRLYKTRSTRGIRLPSTAPWDALTNHMSNVEQDGRIQLRWVSMQPKQSTPQDKTRQDKILHMFQPAWLIGCLIHCLDQVPALFSHLLPETEPLAYTLDPPSGLGACWASALAEGASSCCWAA